MDDNRIYRLTEAPPTPVQWKPKKNTKKAKAAARAAKRRRVSKSAAQGADSADEGPQPDTEDTSQPADDGLGGAKWECIATNLEEVRSFMSTIQKSRDENEKILKETIEGHLLPILEKQEESRKRKALQREKELLSLQKMANAKRSSRLADKAEHRRAEVQAREEEQKRRAEEIAARKEEQKRLKMEKERDKRLMSREARVKEREVRRLQHEEELAQLSEDSKPQNTSNGRMSERRRKAEIEKNKQALKDLEEEDDWIFDCICGAYGQVDDGTHSVACERCNVWQHSSCLGISQEDADRDDFEFICNTCQRKQSQETTTIPDTDPVQPSQQDGSSLSAPQARLIVEIPSKLAGKPNLSPQVIDGSHSHPTVPLPASSNIPVKPMGQASVLPPPSPYGNSEAPHPFSSPHPQLSPPNQSPTKSRAYSTLTNPSSPSAGDRTSGKPSLPPKGIFHTSPAATNPAQASPSNNLPPRAEAPVPSIPAKSDSPLKQPLETAGSKMAGLSTPSTSFSAARPTSSGVDAQSGGVTTPQLKPTQAGSEVATTPTLAPVQNGIPHGISPLKRSPPPANSQSNGISSTPTPAILPPVTALSPSPSHQNLTPPVKSSDPLRPGSQQSSGVAADGRFG